MNMSYCRFRNTLGDLDDCYEALMEKGVAGVKEDADEDEQRAVTRLIKMCKLLAEDYYEQRADSPELSGRSNRLPHTVGGL